MLSKYLSTTQTDWCEYLGPVTFAYNTAVQETTKVSPFFLLFGREPTLPAEAELTQEVRTYDVQEVQERLLAVWNQAIQNIHDKQLKDKVRFDDKHRHVEFHPGDKVKVFTPIRKVGRSEKLLLRWFGPYVILGKINDVDYSVQMGITKNAKVDTVHVSRIAPYHDA